jgi:beta-glucosidase
MQKIEQSARIAATEASADGICLWTFLPMVDIAVIPLGTHCRGYGEDPYLGYQIAKAMVKGYQGEILKKITPSWPVSSTMPCMEQRKPVVIINTTV